MALRVLVVDDHPKFRASVRTLLELDGFEVVGEAADGASAVELARRLEPSLVLLDVSLPDCSGLDLADRLDAPGSAVILTSSREHADLEPRVRASAALGFIPKERLTGEGIRSLLRGAV